VVLSALGISDVRAQQTPGADLSGKWQLRIRAAKGKDEISALDLRESGSSVIGTVTPLKGNALLSRWLPRRRRHQNISNWGTWSVFEVHDISGHIEGDKMIFNVKKGNGSTFTAIAERAPLVLQNCAHKMLQ